LSWWGKLIGGTFGFMLGGPLGAALGAALGHNFDRGMHRLDADSFGSAADVEKIQSAFFTATFYMMGHLAKADGQVTRDEIQLAQQVMQQMNLNAQQKKVAIKLFEQGKTQEIPAQDILQQFKRECHRRRNLIQMFLEILIMTAYADGKLHQAEENLLWHCAQTLGFNRLLFQQILRSIEAQRHFHQQGHAGRSAVDSRGMSLADAYKLLGISSSATDQEVKKAYRRQMNQHHPDKLVSKGLPQEMMDIANQKTQDIKTAYEMIKANRKN